MNKSKIEISDNHGENRPYRQASSLPGWLQWIVLLLALSILLVISTVPLGLHAQLLFAAVAMGFTFLVRPENEKARFRIIVLMVVSLGITSRYIYWRITESMGWFDPNVELTFWDHFFSLGLLAAEMYAWVVLYLGYIQSIWPLQRPVIPLPVKQSKWPSVDVYIPTYNEPLNVVVPSILAARDLDWPEDKLNVYVLDDGCRPEFAEFSKKVGVHYIERKENIGAKAGNINNALGMTDGEYVAIFDSDHAPVRSFLKKTMGWFLRDAKLGLIQTPHLFFTPDPVERNLQVYHRIPNEGQLFYGLVQDGNDNWNATFFCGSCAVMRRDSLEEIGGITADTVTEDAHTSLNMHKAGWNSAYLNIPLAAGLATEKLSLHIAQRRRWARGMTQIFRKDNPMFAAGLSLLQRLSYFNAMLHHLFSLPRLVFLTAPLAYLFFEIHVIQATAAMIAVYALPHIFQAHIANAAMQGRYRHSFWAEVYETILAPHIVIPTLAALIAPNRGKFNVTNKGGVIDRDHFDWSSSAFIFLLLILNLMGLVFGFMRYYYWNTFETDTVILNFLWTVYNTIIIGAALAVAWEKRQRRKNSRIAREVNAQVRTVSGAYIGAVTRDLSIGDMSLKVADTSEIKPHDFLDIYLQEKEHSYRYRARVATVEGQHVGVVFEELTSDQLSKLIYFSHGKEKSWTNWYLACEPSKPISSFLEIVRFGLLGMVKALFVKSDNPENRQPSRFATAGVFLLLALIVFGGFVYPNLAKANESASQIFRQDNVTMTLKDLGATSDIHLRGGNTEDDVWFSLPSDMVTRGAELTLGFSLSPSLINQYQALRVSLNERELGSIPITDVTTANAYRHSVDIDPLLISYSNRLAFKLIPRDENYCERLDQEADYAVISSSSTISLVLGKLDLVNDLSLFPIPFFDDKENKKLDLPIVLPGDLAASGNAVKAAGILASWFGVQVGHLPANFPVFINDLPTQHAVVFATPDNRPEFLSTMKLPGPGLAMMSHPQLSHVKMLVITGRNDQDLIQAVNTLASGAAKLSGQQVLFNSVAAPEKRQDYDAPRWLKTGQVTRLGELVSSDKLQALGVSPKEISLNFRVPPDLYTRFGDSIPVKLDYNYTALPLNKKSGLDIALNEQGLIRYGFNRNADAANLLSGQQQTSVDGYFTERARFGLPYRKLAGNNEISIYYDLAVQGEGENQCINAYSGSVTGSIDPNSTLDLTAFSHYTRYPELAHFANLGFPFTRRADLSETAVIVSDIVAEAELQTVFNLMAKMGASTGLPVYRVNIVPFSQIDNYHNYDLLIIAADQEIAGNRDWNQARPVSLIDGKLQARPLSLMEKVENLLSAEDFNKPEEVNNLLAKEGDDSVVVSGMQSPYDSDRIVVMLSANSPQQLASFSEALFAPNSISQIHGGISVVKENEVINYRIYPTFFAGDLSWFTSFRLFLARHLLGLVLVFLVISLISAVMLKGLLQRHARGRISLA